MTAFLRYRGAWADLSAPDRQEFLARSVAVDSSVAAASARIVDDVRRRGDAALLELARSLDGVDLDRLEVPASVAARALDALDGSLRSAMERAARNIASVQRAFLPQAAETQPEPGITVGRRPDALDRVGIYAPGGRAAYPSSVLMAAIPARVAGVREVVLASPPTLSGLPSPVVLAAAALAGVDRVFAVGGAGAVAAMAYGTETVPRVDRIVGPGNAYVAAAKLLVVGEVGIDAPAGPSELLIIADAQSNAASVAAEMIAQAEHDPLASVVALVADGDGAAIERELCVQATRCARQAIVSAALAARGAVLRVRDAAEAVEVSNAFAPEHLLLVTRNPQSLLAQVRNAGAVFVGDTSSVAFGDYMTGANHVLPTGGSARSYSGLSPLDFVRWTSWQRVDASAARRLSADVATLAYAESLPAHAAAARRWSGAR